MEISLRGVVFRLLPEKVMLKPDEGLMLIADLHLGKAHHFRKEGISIPGSSGMMDYMRLRQLFETYRPARVFFLGDLFHSAMNNEWRHFASLIRSFPRIAFTLIRGNHDIIPGEQYEMLNIQIVHRSLAANGFVYSHEPMPGLLPDEINITGHVHPGISLEGKARQSVKVPCYYRSGNVFVLPAFGSLTGLYFVDVKPGDSVYAVIPGKVISL
jgi:uncharacterized protein